MSTYKNNPAYLELRSRARELDSDAHVVCAQTLSGGWSVTLTGVNADLMIRVRTNDLDRAIDAVLSALEGWV